jgi:putative aldouronate transport system substrate-binding protein
MAPLDSGNGKKPIMRRQTYSTNPTHATAVFSNCEYQEEIAKFFEWSMGYENAMTLNYGMEGVVWDENEDGKMYLNFWESNQDLMNENSESVGFNNSWFCVLPKDLYANNFFNADVEVKGTRAWGFENIYKNFLPYENSVYIAGALDEDSSIMMDQYGTDINTYRKQTFANWITGSGDIDAEWEEYVETMNGLGLEEWLTYKQEAYDVLSK